MFSRETFHVSNGKRTDKNRASPIVERMHAGSLESTAFWVLFKLPKLHNLKHDQIFYNITREADCLNRFLYSTK